jgi:hypothetical protein
VGLKIKYYPVSDLPRLAWLACLDQNSFDVLSVFHGSAVECRETWMVEGVWDGDFQSGDFHKSGNFFGSGIRVEDDRVYFVPSSALVDHLFYCIDRENLLVSNSLTVLLGATGARLDDHHDYYKESTSIKGGVRRYKKEFRVIHPEIRTFYQVFYENVVSARSGISFELKDGLCEVGTFEQYYDRLQSVLSRIRRNYEDPVRRIPVSAFSTISSGYDATAVTCMAKQIGVETCLTIKNSASWIRWLPKYAVDDGTPAAEALELDIVHVNGSRSGICEDELFFLATNYGKSNNHFVLNSIAFYPMAAYIEEHCSAAVLFTGYHGDKVWDVDTPERALGEDLVVHAIDFSLSEIRLKTGFINVAVPYIMARNVRSIVAISRSDDMKPWRLHNDYDRPIPRRIAESSGVPRGAFAVRKKGTARHFYRLPMSRDLRRLFVQHLKKQYNLSSWFVQVNHALNQTAFASQRAVSRIFGLKSINRRLTTFWPELDISFLMWIWATHLLSDKVGQALRGYIGEAVTGAESMPVERQCIGLSKCSAEQSVKK